MTNDVSSVETEDKEKVNQAIQARARNDLSTARSLLEEVVAHSPTEYVYRYKEGDQEFIRFWDVAEFMQYVMELPPGEKEGKLTIWIESVYPRAYYHLACIDVDEGKRESALAHLEACLRLEPDQPLCSCEMAIVHAMMGQHEEAVQLYDKALQARPHIPARTRATALRGKGVQLIELGELDLAETCLKESLQHETSNKLALNELQYIARLRAGGRSAPASLQNQKQRKPWWKFWGK